MGGVGGSSSDDDDDEEDVSIGGGGRCLPSFRLLSKFAVAVAIRSTLSASSFALFSVLILTPLARASFSCSFCASDLGPLRRSTFTGTGGGESFTSASEDSDSKSD
jgi:hypothetical protein